MTYYRPFGPLDLLEFNAVNLDRFTETYQFSFYSHYFHNWPEYNRVACSLDGRPIGYVLGKSEGVGRDWHGHVTAVTVAPSHRKLGIAKQLMHHLEHVSEQGKMYFVDLFVRESNNNAIKMYEGMGYTVYRRVLEYYSGFRTEDGLDLRKSLSRDPNKLSQIPLKRPVHASELDY